MELSKGERLIAAMLADLLKEGGPTGEIDGEFVLSALASGNAWAIEDKYPALFSDDTPRAIIRETHDIMTMWRVIEDRVHGLSHADKAKLGSRNIDFRGFDANDTEGHYGVGRFFVDEMGLYDEFKGRTLNSHGAPGIEDYRRMKAVFDGLWKGSHNLTVDQIIDVLDA